MEEKTAVKKSFKKMPRKKVCAFCSEKEAKSHRLIRWLYFIFYFPRFPYL